MAQKKHPVIIIGGGPAGAVTAMYLLRRGIGCVIIERDIFPRYHVGEAMTGATAVALRELGLGDALDAQRYPIKHGVTFNGTDGKKRVLGSDQASKRSKCPGSESNLERHAQHFRSDPVQWGIGTRRRMD